MYTYKEVVDKIENSRRFGNLPGIEVTNNILDKLGHPEAGMPYVHVAGTNGKGSVCSFLTSVIKKAGLKVGTFTSPHLIDFEERITVDGKMISKEDVTRLGNRLLATDFGVSATMFDYCLVMAVLYFKEQDCDIAVIETGLGGRLDSTNALGVPEVSVITKIGYDHTTILGDTLSQIAAEKAGIIKKGSYVVTETQEKEAYDVIKKYAEEIVGDSFYTVSEEEIKAISSLELKMNGVHQWENAATAAAAARYLLKSKVKGCKIEACIKEGLIEASWPGRMEILSEKPFLMVDGAHNGHGVTALRKSLESMYPGEKFHFIMGVMADKDYEKMIEQLLPLAIDFATVTPESERALQAEALAEYIRKKGVPVKPLVDTSEVFELINREGKNIIFGSLYFVGEIKEKYR